MNLFRRSKPETPFALPPLPNLDFTEKWKRDNPLSAVVEDFKSNNSTSAFAKLSQLKASRTQIEGTDFLRAYYFLSQGQPVAAREAVKEELRYFPHNAPAQELHQKLSILPLDHQIQANREFWQLVAILKPYTMLSLPRLLSLYNNARRMCKLDLPGNFVECGVAAGGSSALLAAVIKKYSKRPRMIYSFDSFDGMPPSESKDTHQGERAEVVGWGEGTCSASEASLKEALDKVDSQKYCQPVKGLFNHTLPEWREKVSNVSLLHMDGDWYSSTRDILVNLYDSVTPGGFVQIDDYGYWEGCKKAVNEFEKERNILFDLNRIDDTGVFFTKQLK
jgi:hypothetical protein